MHPLDNPVWESLRGRHVSLARKHGAAARYPPEVAPFVATDPDRAGPADDLAALVVPGETVLVVGPDPALPRNWSVREPVPIAQMVCRSRVAHPDGPEITEMSDAHRAHMLALTALVYPHYFRTRSAELGRYIGIFDGEILAAMAGERMGFDGHQEISAVCTHPDYTGRGYAQRLLAELTNACYDDGRLPFLHVSHENMRAKSLYERMGYVHRTDVLLWSVRLVEPA